MCQIEIVFNGGNMTNIIYTTHEVCQMKHPNIAVAFDVANIWQKECFEVVAQVETFPPTRHPSLSLSLALAQSHPKAYVLSLSLFNTLTNIRNAYAILVCRHSLSLSLQLTDNLTQILSLSIFN